MNKTEFLKEISLMSDVSIKDCNLIFNNSYKLLCNCLRKGDTISFYGFGKFYVKHINERIVKNNAFVGGKLLAPKNIPVFKMGKAFKEIIR